MLNKNLKQGKANMKKEILLKEDDHITFMYEIDDISETHIDITVFEINQWSLDNEPHIESSEKYLSAYIKSDACSHWWFGDSDKYLHLCGTLFIERHCEVVKKVWELAKNKIIGWDE